MGRLLSHMQLDTYALNANFSLIISALDTHNPNTKSSSVISTHILMSLLLTKAYIRQKCLCRADTLQFYHHAFGSHVNYVFHDTIALHS